MSTIECIRSAAIDIFKQFLLGKRRARDLNLHHHKELDMCGIIGLVLQDTNVAVSPEL